MAGKFVRIWKYSQYFFAVGALACLGVLSWFKTKKGKDWLASL